MKLDWDSQIIYEIARGWAEYRLRLWLLVFVFLVVGDLCQRLGTVYAGTSLDGSCIRPRIGVFLARGHSQRPEKLNPSV